MSKLWNGRTIPVLLDIDQGDAVQVLDGCALWQPRKVGILRDIWMQPRTENNEPLNLTAAEEQRIRIRINTPGLYQLFYESAWFNRIRSGIDDCVYHWHLGDDGVMMQDQYSQLYLTSNGWPERVGFLRLATLIDALLEVGR